MAVSIGDVLDGKYRVIRVVGEGGMGTVYEGEYTRIRRRVAIKVLNPSTHAGEIITRFEREAQAAGRIGNEHILEVYDIGALAGGVPYMVTEFLDGTTLSQRITSHGQVPAATVARIAKQVLVALDAAHNAGIIHRDLKPDNVFVLFQKSGQKDFVKLIDFGISKFDVGKVDAATLKVTRFGSLLGTPTYMSPEIARGASEADARTDIYGVGVIMYEALTGRLPFEGSNLNDLLFNIVEGKPPEMHTLVADLDPELEAMVTRAMARNPADRFSSAAEFLVALSDWMAVRGIGPVPATVPSIPSIEVGVDRSQPPRASREAPTPPERSVPPPTAKVVPTPTLQSSGGAVAGTTNDSIAKGWSGNHEAKASGRTWIALGVAIVVLLGGIGAFVLLRKGPPAPPVTANSAPPPPVAHLPDPTPSAAVSTAPAPSEEPAPPRPVTPVATVPKPVVVMKPVVPAPAPKPPPSASSAPKAPKPPDDEIPGMR